MNDPRLLHELPDESFEVGGFIYEKVREAGYDESTIRVIANLNAWNLSVDEFLEMIEGK
jgi:hypothetical protein